MFIEKIEQAYDDALIAISADTPRVAKAYREFQRQANRYQALLKDDTFNRWLVYHYRDQQGSALDLIDLDESLKESIQRAQLGLFSCVPNGDYYLLKNAVTQRQYTVQNVPFDMAPSADELCFCRLFSYRGQTEMLAHYQFIDSARHRAIVQFIIDQYDDTMRERYYSIDDFINQNPLLLWGAVSITDNIAHDEQTMVCHELVCAVVDMVRFQNFLASVDLKSTSDQGVYSWYANGRIAAEVVCDANRVSFECNCAEDLQWVVDNIDETAIGVQTIETKLTHLDDIFDR